MNGHGRTERRAPGPPDSLGAGLFAFFKGHWLHVFFAAPGALLVTVAHEAAHCAAALVQGGTVTEFVWLPGGGYWGHMRYEFPQGVRYSSFVISIAPYVFWLVVAAGVALLSLRRRAYPFWLASTLFVWGFVVPLADVANAAFPYLAGAHNDLRSAFGWPTAVAGLVVALLTLVAMAVGFVVQRRLYRERALGPLPFVVLSLLAVGGISVVSGAAPL